MTPSPTTKPGSGNAVAGLRGGRLRIAVVAGHLAKFEGISGGVQHTIRAVSSVPDWKVSVFSPNNDIADISVHLVNSAGELSSRPDYREADVIIYHFGFFHDVFEAIKGGNGHARQIVFFHNITPEQYVSPLWRGGIRRAFAQLANLQHADWLWPVSKTNADVLVEAGFDPARIEIVPPVIEWPPAFQLGSKETSPVQVLFVGRIVQSKGVLDLVRAVRLVRSTCSIPFRVKIVGKLSASNDHYYLYIKETIQTCGLDQTVEFLGTTESEDLAELYRHAHILAIPSYHEGFCRPVGEGLRAGCIPVGYSSYNLPHVANGLGRLVAPGDIAALADALGGMIEAVARAKTSPSTAELPLDGGPLTIAKFDAAAAKYVSQFSFDNLRRSVTDRIRILSP
jgi:glycosyltransferase involved in cell wall biosynthesis